VLEDAAPEDATPEGNDENGGGVGDEGALDG
jgi:hypothetical protein